MLVIRKNQMETMQHETMKVFELRVLEHLRQFFPEECRRAGDERTRAAIRQGIRRAETYGIEMQRHVAVYIDLSAALGLDFDSSRRYPWAKEILGDESRSAAMKIQALVRHAKNHLATQNQRVG
jgi:hypothetical protein